MSMEKNRIKPTKSGRNLRMSYSRKKEVVEMPNLIEVQRDSYQWFLDEGLSEAFADISPITDYSGKLSLEFTNFVLDVEGAKYTIEESVFITKRQMRLMSMRFSWATCL